MRTHKKIQRGHVAAKNLIGCAETVEVTQHKLGGNVVPVTCHTSRSSTR